MANNFTLTEEQQEILNIKEGLHLVLAPPGSGKTELLAQRVSNAKNSGFEDGDIICLTFTNRAAKGMNERIEGQYPNNEISIGNVHHFCSLFLFRNKLIQLNTSILDEEDADQMLNELKEKFNYPPKNENVYNPDLLKLATYLKQKELGFPEELFLKPKSSEIPEPWKAKELCEAYIKEKQENSYLDFDDLLTLTYHYLTHKNKDELLLSQFKWLQVDEVQDLNPLQWAIIHEITAPNSLIVYFGDYEQAIFSFMGAKLESLHKIEQQCKAYSKNGIHNFTKNFRSPSYLLDIYIQYAQTHWTPTWKKPPIPNVKQEAPANSLCCYEIQGNIENEARYISETIISKLLTDDDKTAIIVRFNKSADIISKKLKQQDIPHFKISGFDIFRRKTVKGLMAFFSIFLSEYDRLSWARLFYEFEIKKTLKECRNFVNSLNTKGITPIDILKYNGKSSRLSEFFGIFANQEMVVFDTETTGLDTENDDIIQIAAVKIVNGKVKETFEVYINTEKDVTESEKVHHISKEHLNLHGVSHEKGLSDFMQFIGRNAVLVAHNIEYDYSILKFNLLRYGKAYKINDYCKKQFDTITIAKLIYPTLASYKLKDLLEFLKVEGVNSHNALDDVKATVSLIEKLNSDFCDNLQSTQNNYLIDSDNAKIFDKFIRKFEPLYSSISKELFSRKTLNSVINIYFEYNPPRQEDREEEMREIDKLVKHIDYYTNKNDTLTLKQRIEKYIPDYRMFKESDLYLGTEKVVVSTVYKAKGLEFDNVIVAEATDDTYPVLWTLKNATQEEKAERILEDTRAFYVAMTRSKKKLYITSHTRSPYGHPKEQSKFIECISKFFDK
jgi:DNA helicase-2/ATP-dependent DNA helicase PcrA